MGYFIQPIVTDKAISETALAIQNREPLVFTRIALGSGRHRTDIGKKNNIVQVVHSLQVAQSLSTDAADTIRLTARFDNSRIEREMIVNESVYLQNVEITKNSCTCILGQNREM